MIDEDTTELALKVVMSTGLDHTKELQKELIPLFPRETEEQQWKHSA